MLTGEGNIESFTVGSREILVYLVVVDLRGLRGESVLDLVHNTHRAGGGAALLCPAFSVSAGFNCFRFLYEDESVLTLSVRV